MTVARPRRIAAALLTLAVASCHGPVGPFAGGRLSGEVVRGPAEDWSDADGHRLAEVEVRPSDPYSVHVNFYRVGESLYVEAGPRAWSRWRRFLREDPGVRVRFGDRIRDCVAVPVTDPAEIATVLPVYYAKDSSDPPPGCVPDGQAADCLSSGLEFYRLDPR